MKKWNLVLGILLGMVIWGNMSGVTLAQSVWTWNGGNGNWDTDNWTPAGYIPGDANNEKEIIASGEVILGTTKASAGLEIGSAAGLLAYKSLHFNWPDVPRNVSVINQGSIQLLATSEVIMLDAYDTVVTFSGSGTITLAGSGQHELSNSGWGGSFNNENGHTIRGSGYIYTDLTNRGKVTANSGTLMVGGGFGPFVDNTNGILEALGTGSVLRFQTSNGVDGGQILPNDGEVHVEGTTFKNTSLGPGLVLIKTSSTFGDNVALSNGTAVTVADGQSLTIWNGWGGFTTLTNNGTVTLASAIGTWLDMRDNTVTLSGSGQVVLGGQPGSGIGNGGWGGTCTNDVHHTVRGGGSIDCFFTNLGNLVADNGVLRINNTFTGPGPVTVTDTGTLEITTSVQLGDFSMSQEADWIVWSGGKVVDIQGDLSFAQQEPGKWTFQDEQVTLKMSGGQQTTLEIGGRDYGLSSTGFTDNFHLPKLLVSGIGTYTRLMDAADNGHRSSSEVLYVTQLQVDPGATLYLNGLRLYTKREGIICRVQGGEGDLYGGGRIIDGLKISLPIIVK